MAKNCERIVEFAVGFSDNTWKELEIRVTEDPAYALEDQEVIDEATKVIEKVEFPQEISFYHVLYVSEPESLTEEEIESY